MSFHIELFLWRNNSMVLNLNLFQCLWMMFVHGSNSVQIFLRYLISMITKCLDPGGNHSWTKTIFYSWSLWYLTANSWITQCPIWSVTKMLTTKYCGCRGYLWALVREHVLLLHWVMLKQHQWVSLALYPHFTMSKVKQTWVGSPVLGGG